MKKYLILIGILTLTLILMFINSSSVLLNAKESINILLKSFLPSLFPYMVIITLINELGGLLILGYLLQYIFKPIFNVNAKESSLIIAGIISGYPLPSVLLSKQNCITRKEQSIISIFVFPSFAFLLSHIFPNIGDKSIYLLITFILGSFILFFVINYNDKEKVEYMKFSTLTNELKIKYNNIRLSKLVRSVFINSSLNMIIISSNIIIFSLFSLIFPQNKAIWTFFQGLLDFSRASVKLSQNGSILSYIALIFVLLFGGVSIFMQNSALLADTNFSIKKYIFYRLELIVIVILLNLLIFF